MRKKTKILSLLIALVTCFAVACCFVGCGGETISPDGITLSASTLTIEEGKSTGITAIVIDQTVEWEIGDDTVVSITKVQPGVYSVTGLKAGTTTITAKAGDKTATCTVTVTKAAEVGGDEEVIITLLQSTLSVEVGKSAGITATVSGTDKAIEWEIGDDTVVSITAGEGLTYAVAGLKEGTTTITAKIGDKTATCTVTVTKPADVGGNEDVENIDVAWETVADPIYGEVTENGADYIYHHLFFNDAVDKAYDFDGFDVTVKVDGEDGEVVNAQAFNDNDVEAHTYHMHIRIIGNRYQTTVFSITFKKNGEAVATATYTRNGDREIALDSVSETVSVGETTTVSVTSINGNADLTGKTIAWSIADTEGEGVATIPDNATGASVEITAVAAGKATLTCTVGEGENAFSKTCAITVVEGAVVIVAQDVTAKLVLNDKFGPNGIQFRIELQEPEFAELVQQIDPSKTTAAITIDGAEATFEMPRKEWQAQGVYNLWIQVLVGDGWTHDYAFRFSFKNAKGDEVAYAAYTEAAPKILNIDNTSLNLTLKTGETVTGTITATKNDKVEGDISWTIDDSSVATISVSDDGLSVTVTAVAKGTATVTATADGLTKTCTVNVLEDGEEVPVLTITDFRVFEGPYGENYYKFIFEESDPNVDKYPDIKASFDHTDVDGVTSVHKEFYQGGGAKTYIVTVKFAAPVEAGKTYKIDLCDASGNILCTFSWTAPAAA